MTTTRTFPADFVWGTATASYQIEGGAAEGGRTPSIWDTFSKIPGKVLQGDTGDVACDHYHRWAQDVELLTELGVGAYRLSISWSRVQPHGSGPLNPEGVAFYVRLLDALRANGIKAYVTLYHWDLPQEWEDKGGWTHRETAYAFAEYARLMAEQLGERVEMWTTLNEPWCSAFLGYGNGYHAPGLADGALALTAAHHLNLAHGLAVAAIRSVLPGAQTSIVLNPHAIRPATDSDADREAARRIAAVGNEIFFGPLLDGAYPADLLEDTAHVTDWSFVRDGDLALVHQPIDLLGINYYSVTTVAAGAERAGAVTAGPANATATVWVGSEDVEFPPTDRPVTGMGWNITPDGLTELLVDLSRRYPSLPLAVTENGAAFDDEVVMMDGIRRVHDKDRLAYIAAHVDAVGAALDAGVDLRAYFVWSALDNFEWAFGYSKRFGIIHVDFATGERTWKDSALWYRDLITAWRGGETSAAADEGATSGTTEQP